MNEEQRESQPTHSDPWRDLGPYREWGSLARGLMDELFAPRLQRTAALSPAIDIDENEDGYDIAIELPGVSKDDIDVHLEANVLTVRGEKRQERRDESKKGRRRWTERTFGAFQRAFTLPSDADAERLEASFRDGVLHITLPKTEAAKPRTIAVK